MGSAIQLDPQSGMAALKLDFSLSKTGSRVVSAPAGQNSASVTGDPMRMSVRGLLHYLWHEAELTIWTSRWAEKRYWWNVRWHLLEAPGQITVRGGPLADILFVPEPFRAENREAIEQRRNAVLDAALPPKSGPRKTAVAGRRGEEIVPARSGQKIVIRHLPGFPFIVHDAFASAPSGSLREGAVAVGAHWNSHLLAIATFGLNPAGLAIVEISR